MDLMDFESMKRRELQALCKNHGLPANSTNSQMALSLASLLQKNEKIKLRGCLKGSDESSRENSGPKKVSFSLDGEEFEFEKSLGIPEKRRSTRRASTGVIKANDQKTRVPEVPARITRSRTVEVSHPTASQEDEGFQSDEGKKRKESSVMEPNLRSLRNRVVIFSGNECELQGNQKLKRSLRRDAGKQKENPKVDAFQNMKLGGDGGFEKKISRKRARVADVEEVPPCNTDYGNTRPESDDVDAGAQFKVTQCGGPPPRRSKRVLLNTETMVFDVGAAKKVEALPPKRSTRSSVKCGVEESEISTDAEEKSGDEFDAVGGKKQMKSASSWGIKSKGPAVSEIAREFITESTTTEARGQPEVLPEFRVPPRRTTRSSSKQVAMELVTLLPASEKLVDGKETARASKLRKKHGSRKPSENLCPSGETESAFKTVEVQAVHFEKVPLHPMQNTCKIGVAECEATEGFKQVDDVARREDSIASPRIHAESEALAVPKQKALARRSTRNSTKNEALLTSAMKNTIPKEKAVARRSTRHSTKNEAPLTTVPQNVPVEVGKNRSTAKRAREVVPDEDASYVERDTSGRFPVSKNQENGTIVDGNDRKPGSHVPNTRGSKSCRRVNSIDEAPPDEHSTDPPLSLLEDSCQHIIIGEGSASNVSSKSQSSQRLQSMGKMPFDVQKNSEDNIHNRSGDDKLVDEHKCLEEVCSTHEDQVMISGSSEVMNVCKTLEATPCSAVQDNCAQNVDEEKICEARNCVLVDIEHSSLSMHANGSFGPAETVTEAVGNPQIDALLALEQTKKGFTACTLCVENVEQVNTAEVSHEFIDSESTPVVAADSEMVLDVIHNIHNEDDPKHREPSHSVVGISLTCEEIQELTSAIDNEVSLGIDQQKFATVADVPDAREISSHLTDTPNDTHVNHSEDSSDQQSAPLKDMGTAEATLTTMLVFKSATETFGYVEEINEADKNFSGSCSGKLAFEDNKETLMLDSENFSLSVGLQENSAEFARDQMKPSLRADRLAAVQCAGMSPREIPKSLSCYDSSHDGSCSQNHMIAIRPGARMHVDKEISASEYMASLTVDKDASEVLDGMDAKNYSEMEGDCNASLDEKFCEDSIDLLPPTTGDLLEKRVEDIGMAANDIEFPFLSEDVDSEMKVMEKVAVLEVHDGIDAKNHLELEGDSNVSFEERFCEVSIDPLPPTAGDLLEERDEDKEMVAKDKEFPLPSEDVVSKMKVMEKEAILEVLDGRDAKNHSESEGGSNTSLEERFCEASIDPLPPTAGHLLEKPDENKEMATEDIEVSHLSENLACEMEVTSEKPGCLDPEEDGATLESQLQMDHESATLLRLDGTIIDSKSGIQKVILEVVGEDASETCDGCHEDVGQDNERTKFSSVDVVLQQFIFREEASTETVSEDFQQTDYTDPSTQLKIQDGDEMASHRNSYSTVDSVDIHDLETHDSSNLQTDLENQMQAPTTFVKEREVVSWDDSQTCETLPRDLKNSTAAYFPVDMGNVSGETDDSHHDDEKASQVRNIPVTDDLVFQLCSGGLLQQDIHEKPDEDNLKDVLGPIDCDTSITEPKHLIYILVAGDVSGEVGSSNANTTVASDENQITASPCNFHEDRDCVSPSLVDDLKSAEETEIHAFNGQLMDTDEVTKHDLATASDDLNKENMETSEGDVMADEDGNGNSRAMEENTLHKDVPFLLQRVCDNSNELHYAGIAAYSSDIYESHSGLTPLQNASLPSQTKNDRNMVKLCTAAEMTIDKIEKIEDKFDNDDREVRNFVKGSEPTISEVDADDATMGHECGDVSEIAEQSIWDQDVMKIENMDMVARYGSDDIEGAQVAKGESESTSVFNICENFKDGENANGCQDENSMFADMMVEKENNTDITNLEGTLAESRLCEAPSSAGQLVSVSKELLYSNWTIDSTVDVCQAVSGGHDDREIYQDTMKHEVNFQTETSNLQNHDYSSERIDSVDFEETKDCGIRAKESTNLEGHEQIEETFHETDCQAAETRQTIDPEPQHPLAKETLINSLDCQASGLSCDERGLFQDITFPENDDEQGLGNERGDELCSGKVKDQNDVHKLSNETSVVENTSDETENNSNGIEIYRMEETKCILNQSSAFQEPVCAESADQAEESMNQENQSVSSFDCSPSKFRNHANTDDSGIDLLDEINHKLINFNISSANKFKKVLIHKTPMQLLDALRPQTQISELKNKENAPLVKIEHSIIRTVEKSRRPLQSLQNNEKVQQP
ncbi:uncharacterized protein LOC120252936 isoform X4 [Dioscorea cayenensis subsp. rotundata]|uniref:Uncharacterized protein LOC120252936 isoform X4 n=1 Tax=Dioscorea cayennensis subsp. rotundata TaxID=55577 RepID=A0AB40AQJ2_DIOCR|nr:uncharacterized protein LOC120252936 isoform X4 [Dioscorea cayenensis subsp. rotundata]